jgi:hypothetical protein
MQGKSRLDEDCATFERVNELLEYNPFNGKISWKIPCSNQKAGDAAGYLDEDYLRISIDGKTYYAHRLAHLLMTGHWPEQNPEHKNQQGADNRWKNIKDLAPQHDNVGNTRLNSRNTSGLRGVTWDKRDKKWKVRILVYGKNIHLGRFDDKEEAGLVWDAAAKIVWSPRFQYLNFLDCFSDHIVLKPKVLRQIEAAMNAPVNLAEAA